MKVIFLDIDGVLITSNNVLYGLTEIYDSTDRNNGFDNAAVRNLNRLLDMTDARIVISSSLRLTNSVPQLVSIMKYGGVKNPHVIGVTPFVADRKTKRSHRGTEILVWLSNNPNVNDYIVIDDCDNGYLSGIPHERIVKTTYRNGFGSEDAYRRAVAVLQPKIVNTGVEYWISEKRI